MSERGLAAVTGASGRLGAAVVRALREDGWRVRALVHRRDAPGADETVRGDVLDPAALERLRAASGGRSRIVHVPEPLVRAAAAAARVLPLPLYPDQPARLRAERPPPTPEAEADLGFRPRPFPGAPERG